MFKIRNYKQFQTILVITTILFMLSIYLTQYIINEKIYKINFFKNDKYNFIVLDEYGEIYYHYEDLKSWSKDLKRPNIVSKDLKEEYNSILTNKSFKTDYLYSKRLKLNMDKGLILVSELKQDYIDEVNNINFKRNLLFFAIFAVVTFSMLTLALIIIRTSNTSLERFKKLSKDYQSLQKFSTQAEEVGQIGLWEDDAYNSLKWNNTMYTILGIENYDTRISYEMFLTYIHPDDKEKFDKEYKYSKNISSYSYITFRIITNTNQVKWVEQRWMHFYNDKGNFVKTIGSLYDISFNKEIEYKLSVENKNLKNYFDALNIPVIIINNEMEIVFFNDLLLKTLGISKRKISKESSFLSLISEDKDLFKSIVKELLEKNVISSKDIRLNKNNAEIETFKAEFKLVHSNNEILIRLDNILKDKENKDNFLINQSRLADLGEMLIDLTYKWRQSLTIISTSASFLKLEHEINTQQKNETIKVLSKIIQSSTNLSKTIDDFKYYVEDDKSESRFSVNMSIKKVLQLLSNSIIENGIEVVTDFDEDVELKNVENSFMQVLVNIIKNSIDALKENQKSKRLIFISTEIFKDKLNITVLDNAHGIEDKVLPFIFDEFFTTKSDKKATGLGMFLAKKIVNSKLKGILEASNKEYYYKDKEYKGASLKISLSILNNND